ncbi:hypothetical protein JYT72_02280 [Crocinitomix catalasitica]|nr:hypothetical protein [Crocinitomix catalasitica]
MKCLFAILILLGTYSVFGQGDLEFKNSFSTCLFKLENTSATLHNKLEPKFITGISYERRFSKWSWISSVQYGENLIQDNCNNCFDQYYGTGQLKELNFFSGLNFTFNQFSKSKIKWFIGTDAYISLLNYRGDFMGGISGAGAKLNRNHMYIGGLQRFGMHYYLVPRLRFSVITSFRLGLGWRQQLPEQGYKSWAETSVTVPQVKVGFLF